MHELPKTLEIKDLYPFEVSVIGNVVKEWEGKIKNNEQIDKIRILEINGKYLVTDGHHRVMAMKNLGKMDIPVEFSYIHEQDLKPYQDALKKNKKHKGFKDFPITSSDGTRRQEIKNQMNDIIPTATDNFCKIIQEKMNCNHQNDKGDN